MNQQAPVTEPGPAQMPENSKDNSQVKQLKADLIELYETLDNYYANNYYYELLAKPNPNHLSNIVLKKVSEGMKTVEIGLNPGVLTIECSLKKADAMGVDTSPMRVVIAENLKHIEHERFHLINKFDVLELEYENIPNTKYKVITPSTIDLPDNSIDLAFSDGAFKDIELNEIITETARILKPGAEFYIRINKKDNNKLKIDDKTIKSKVPVQVFSDWGTTIGLEKVYYNCVYNNFVEKIILKFPFLRNSSLLSMFEKAYIAGFKKIN